MATFNSDRFNSGQTTPSVPPGAIAPVSGTVSIPANTSFATTDTIPLFKMPGPNSYIVGFTLSFPALDGGAGLTTKLVDSKTSPTTLFATNTTARAGGVISETVATQGTIGTQNTYTTDTTVSLVPDAASTNTSGAAALVIGFQFYIAQL